MLGRKRKGAGDEAWNAFLAGRKNRPVSTDEKTTADQPINDPSTETLQIDQSEQLSPEPKPDALVEPDKRKSPRVVAVLGSLATPRHRDVSPQD